MEARSCRHAGLAAAVVLAVTVLTGPGCVSSKYKMAPKSAQATQPMALEITSAGATASAKVNSIVVFHGPGSWKKDAYWDEYIVTLKATGDEALAIESAVLVDQAGQATAAGADPWALDASSRARLKVARQTGRKILLGAGVGAAWYGSAALIASGITIWGGVTNSTAVAAGAAGFVAIPVAVVGSGVRTLVARHAITREFNERRMPLPATIAAGASRTGSFFFPVTPAPAKLLLRCQDPTGTRQEVVLDLAPLAALHLGPAPGQKASATATGAAAGTP